MARFNLRCVSCSARTEADLSELEEHSLRTQSYLTRFCARCRGQTRWQGQAAAASSFRAEYATPAPPRQASLLLIDDDESILKILQTALGSQDYQLELANSARKAMQLLGRDDYDLVISDVRMPEFDGKQLFAFLDQNLPEYRSRVIFVTGDTANDETKLFLEQSHCPYLTKPLDLPKLLELVKVQLQRNSPSPDS